MNTPEIEELKLLVEQKFGRALCTTTDFEEFSLCLGRRAGHQVSSSTLKRLWGYVRDNHQPRMTTLNALAYYLGHQNFSDFNQWLKTSTRYNSSFFRARQLISASLSVGAEVIIGWSPNRTLHLRYLGNSAFEVMSASNSKLLAGDRFVAGCFIMGQPLCLPFVVRDGRQTPPFVAGRNGGLTVIELVDEVINRRRKAYEQ